MKKVIALILCILFVLIGLNVFAAEVDRRRKIDHPIIKKEVDGVAKHKIIIPEQTPDASSGTSADANAAGNVEVGKVVYDTSCMSCHKTGIMGAPKVGDKALWAPRIAQGTNALVSHASKGYTGKKGMMPAKGGNTNLTDAQVGDAVNYMVKHSK